MSNEVLIMPQEERGNSLPVSQRDVDMLIKQQELLETFVRSQLKPADFSDIRSPSYGEGDYGIIPGTKKLCLFKQGAEKFQKLFALGCRFKQVSKEIDRHSNFAMYEYKAEIYALRNPDVVIAECDGSVNSQETKYKERKRWITKTAANGKDIREQITEETPIFDILNTLQKMAQKRAMIGATILATGASKYFTQDVLEPEDVAPSKVDETQSGSNQSAAPSTQSEEAPICHDKPMMISKYPNRDTGAFDWYCLKCKTSKPRNA